MITTSEVFARARHAIFRIPIEPSSECNFDWGTGFFIYPAGYALTAFHNLRKNVSTSRHGHVRALDSDGKPFFLDLVPMLRDEARDIALLQVREEDRCSFPFLRIASLPEGLSEQERVRFWAGRAVLVCGFPIYKEGSQENAIPGLVRGDAPFGIIAEFEADRIVAQVERLKIVPDHSTDLPGISGGPVIDLATGLVAAVEGSCELQLHLIFASEIMLSVPAWPDEVRRSLAHLYPQLPRLTVNPSRLPVTGQHLFGRKQELAILNQAWEDSGKHIVTFYAWGGVGKTSLVKHWLGQMAGAEYRGAEYVFDWSFYRQGSGNTAISADEFINSALRFFGDTDPAAGSPWERGERLARLSGDSKTLLIIDGLEPVQYPSGTRHGGLKDPAMEALLRGLAARNRGLCVVTTRERVREIADWTDSTCPSVELERLPEDASIALLKELGVRGTDRLLRKVAIAFDRHALSLSLLGNYLRRVHGGDAQRLDQMTLGKVDPLQGFRARGVMDAYEKWFEQNEQPVPWAILRLLGLFDRPADESTIAVLRATPPIRGLTEPLVDLESDRFEWALADLMDLGLLAKYDRPDPRDSGVNKSTVAGGLAPYMLDVHPLVREYFAGQLHVRFTDAAKEAHLRLYEHLKGKARKLPETFDEMLPLYEAVPHGCKAGRHQEALDDVYLKRILRNQDFYSTRRLRAFGADLALLDNFRALGELNLASRAFVMRQSGYCLRALGRVDEALTFFESALRAHEELNSWFEAAIDAAMLSITHAYAGNLDDAETYARAGVAHAEQSGSSVRRWFNRSALATVLYQMDQMKEAEEVFRQVQQIQVDLTDPEYPTLNASITFRYCELLEGQHHYDEMKSEAEVALQLLETHPGSDHHLAIGNIGLGRAEMHLQDLDKSIEHFSLAVELIRSHGVASYYELPLALTARAEALRMTNRLDEAQRDLDQALAISSRSGMKLRETDCHLQLAHLHIARSDLAAGRQSLNIARTMMNRIGYSRRKTEIARLNDQLTEWTVE